MFGFNKSEKPKGTPEEQAANAVKQINSLLKMVTGIAKPFVGELGFDIPKDVEGIKQLITPPMMEAIHKLAHDKVQAAEGLRPAVLCIPLLQANTETNKTTSTVYALPCSVDKNANIIETFNGFDLRAEIEKASIEQRIADYIRKQQQKTENGTTPGTPARELGTGAQEAGTTTQPTEPPPPTA